MRGADLRSKRSTNNMNEELLSRYPFIREGLKEYLGSGISLEDFLKENEEYLSEVSEDILALVNSKDVKIDWETERRVKKYIIAKILLTFIRDYFVSAKYAMKERKVLYENLHLEKDDRVIAKIARELNIKIEPSDGKFLIPIPSFLRNAVVFNDRDLKLCNQEMFEGNVIASKDIASKIIREAFYRKYMEDVNELSEFPEPVASILKRYADKIIVRGTEIKRERANLGPMNKKAFPPCLNMIISQMEKGKNVSHPARFFIVTFLHRIGLPNDEIIKYFGEVPDYLEKMTRYQVEHITGTGRGREYSTPSCQTLSSLGLCYRETDDLCKSGKINHPLQYYKIKNSRNRPVSNDRPVDGVDDSSNAKK